MRESGITRWLRRAPALPFSLYAVGASFATYFCMYGFRKTFTVGSFAGGGEILGVGFKAVLIISQLFGYTLSKYVGVKYLSELPAARRGRTLVGAVLLAEGALVLLGLVPPEAQIAAIFLNGLPLGLVWGLVYAFLEGRRTSEILGAGLSCSFIVASGAARSAGKVLMDLGVPELWMPAAAGLVYLPFFLASTWLLTRLPPPSAEDVAARVQRRPMDATSRRAFVREFALGLFFLLSLYFILTAFRDYRDNFVRELFDELRAREENRIALLLEASPAAAERTRLEAELAGVRAAYSDPGIFAKTEILVALPVLAVLALLYLIQDNLRAFLTTHWIMMAGTVLVGGSTLLFEHRWIDGVDWIVLTGLGLYLAYVPYGSILFDRLVAAMGTVATAVFTIYVADALGYTGSVGVVLYKELARSQMPKVDFFVGFAYFTSAFCTLSYAASMVYFTLRRRRRMARIRAEARVE